MINRMIINCVSRPPEMSSGAKLVAAKKLGFSALG